jgi:hypothetical protein
MNTCVGIADTMHIVDADAHTILCARAASGDAECYNMITALLLVQTYCMLYS